MNPVPFILLAISLPLLLWGCGEKSSPEGSKSTSVNQTALSEEVKPEEPVAETIPAESVSVSPHLKYETGDDAVTITGCDKKALGALIIPATIDGNPVTSIGNSAFYYLTLLTSITIPDSVTSIGDSAFYGCSNLTTIEVGAGNMNYTVANGVLFNTEKTLLHAYPADKTGSNYTIPDYVTSIKESAFSSCKNLTSIMIPNSVTSIRNEAFRGCTNLTSITIPDSVTSIEEWTFSGCRTLTSITIPDSVTSIGKGAFDFCKSLTSITIPDGVTRIGDSAFISCTSLTAVTFLGDAPKAGKNIFYKATPTIYRKPEAKGWGETFGGRPVKLISEKP